MSVDTYLKRKNLAPYRAVEYAGVRVLVAPSLLRWAEAVRIDAKQFLVWKSFEVGAAHRHGAACRH